tara:strand:+ start:135 stop:359 length:225 start_codon:yes stop_codon:yes gene_type:complete
MQNRIKEVLREKGIKQKFLCDKLNINESVLSLIINNKRVPSQDRIKSLAKALNTPIRVLFPTIKVKKINWYILD